MALRGLKVIEMAGLAPAPFAGMILADFGASVIRIDKPSQPPLDCLGRNKRSLAVNLKHKSGVDVVKRLCKSSDILLECYRPGVMEKMGLGPTELSTLNKKLIYVRLTGYGQSGSHAHKAGHDINFLAISGILSMLGGKNQPPLPPINLLADFSGGSLICVIGILMALFERQYSGCGQIIDSAMVDGSAYLGSFLTASRKLGIWTGSRGENLLDGGAPFYCCYKTSDCQYMSVGAIEPQFYQALMEGLHVDDADFPNQLDSSRWVEMKETFAKRFESKSRDEWIKIFSKLDACVEPVLTIEEAAKHQHNVHRNIFKSTNLDIHMKPAPKLQRTPAQPETFTQPIIGDHTDEILNELSYSTSEIADLKRSSAVFQSPEAKL